MPKNVRNYYLKKWFKKKNCWYIIYTNNNTYNDAT